MIDNSGWVKLHRQFLTWEWYDDLPTFRVFMHLLLTANYEPTRYHGFAVPAGGLVIGLNSLAKSTCISIQQTRTALAKLKSTNEITIQTTNNFSIVTITCWEKYQSINTPINKPSTNDQQTTNKPSTTDKEVKKLRREEVKKELIAPDLSFVAEPYQPCFEKWLTYKREIGSPYKGQTSLKTCYNQLLKMADNNPATAAEIVDNSIGNRYQGLFAPKGGASGRPASKQMNTWDDNGYGKDIPL